MKRTKIAVFSPEEFASQSRLLGALSQLYPVDFVAGQQTCYDAAVLFGATRSQVVPFSSSGVRCMAFLGGSLVRINSSDDDVCFGTMPYLDRCFRGKRLPDKTIEAASLLKREVGDEVVACKGDRPLWIHRSEGFSRVDLVAMQPPRLEEQYYLFRHFRREDWARLFPLLHFSKEISRASAWQLPPARACFMFDDPNLHSRSYGYIHYLELVEHAERHNYHVSFATVPLDAWYIDPKTAMLFRESKGRLSLLVHGNNHTSMELAQPDSEPVREGLIAQALSRIERLERLSGLTVPRVMAAPHGACSDAMAAVMLRMGFEAACISRSSMMAHNGNQFWPKSVGLQLAEYLGDGLPIIPRFGLTPTCSSDVLLASFLGQPVIPVGHHNDIGGGLDLLQQLSELINSLGEVQWTDLASIARSNFTFQRDSNLLHVRMYSRRIKLTVPEGITQVCVERPWLKTQTAESLSLCQDQSSVKSTLSHTPELIYTKAGAQLEICSVPANAIDPAKIPLKRTPLWVIGRRQLCELRDRLRPAVDRLRFTNFRNDG